MENTNQKVYINPNFYRSGTYVNKHFPQLLNNPQNVTRKIFVNPHFVPLQKFSNCQLAHVKKDTTYDSFPTSQENCHNNSNLMLSNKQNMQRPIFESQYYSNVGITTPNSQKYQNNNPKIVKSRYSLIRNNITIIPIKSEEIVKQVVSKPIENQNTTATTTEGNTHSNNDILKTKSRYSLVRKNEPVLRTPTVKSNTIKISKYKITTLNNLKKDLQMVKEKLKSTNSYHPVKVSTQKNISFNPQNSKLNLNASKYRYKKLDFNRKKLKAISKEPKLASSTRNLSFVRQTKTMVGKYKINNIPCPLFVKYGTCLRKNNRGCEYLHDKKHVSLCRKFIKGICHDSKCLLSHELTTKKMPTCYFYLTATCTKENCPYLHVKLNSQSKLCQDFLKGYCEKGENCLERHIQQPFTSKKKSIRKRVKLNESPHKKMEVTKTITKITKKKDIDNPPQTVSDRRYYKDAVSEKETCKTIKPQRCKLGTLPSYINAERRKTSKNCHRRDANQDYDIYTQSNPLKI